jgi:hypothetical protein
MWLPMSESMVEPVRALSARIKHSQHFRRGSPDGATETNLEKLLDLYVKKFPTAPSVDEIKFALNGRSTGAVEIGRLNERLMECFLRDRSLWSGQERLFVPRRGRSAGVSIQLGPLSDILSPTERFWFHQCSKLRRTPEERETFIVFSEPLFFFCKTLRAYFRFLDVNHDERLEPSDLPELVNLAKARLRRAVKVKGANRTLAKFIEDVDLVPVRVYMPAGDSYAAVAVRRWFRNQVQEVVNYREAQHLSAVNLNQSNLIVVLSRRGAPLNGFEAANPQLRLRLTDNGIRLDNKLMSDEFGNQGVSLARVVVTNWVCDTENVYTIIASNHTRAVDAVANWLTNDDTVRQLSDALITADGRIPKRFQVAFEVQLQVFETHSNAPILLPELKGKPIVYD